MSGISQDTLSCANAYIGVSFSMTRYFSRSRMREYIEWAGEKMRNLLIIVADHFEGYNIQVFKQLPPEEAFSRALMVGENLVKGYVRAVPGTLRSKTTVVLASELLVQEDCASLVRLVREEAANNHLFWQDCRNGISEMISGKLDDAGLTGATRELALDLLHSYIYEEIAIILYVAHVMQPKWPVALFPYEPRNVITKLYGGSYSKALCNATRNEPFRFVKLASPSFEASRAGGLQ